LFPTTDGHVVVAIGNDTQFARYCEAIGRAELATDPRFVDNRARVENRDAIVAILEQAMAGRSSAEWLERLAEAMVPSGPVNTIDQVFDDPQIKHRGMKVELPHTVAGTVAQPGSPMRLSVTPVEYTRAAPILGEHTDTVLSGLLGLDAEAVAALRADGVI